MNNYLSPHDVLIVTTRKGAWGSESIRALGSFLYTRKVREDLHSTHWINSIMLLLRTVWAIWSCRPKVVVVGTAVTVGIWLRKLKSWGVIPASLVLHNRHYREIQSGAADLVIHDSTQEVEVYSQEDNPVKHVFIPYCMEYWKDPEPKCELMKEIKKPFFLSTGSAGRDYSVLDQACTQMTMSGVVTAQLRDSVTQRYVFKSNIHSYYNLSDELFQKLLRECSFVVVALKSDPYHMGGGSTVLKALQHGKPVITEPYHRDYVVHGRNGLLIDTTSVRQLANAMKKLSSDDAYLHQLSENACIDGKRFGYDRFARDLSEKLQIFTSI